jgi:DNA-binding PucR family transcriptional regulator
MANSVELLRAWVIQTLGSLTDDDHHARLGNTPRVLLQENASFKATADRLILHKALLH